MTSSGNGAEAKQWEVFFWGELAHGAGLGASQEWMKNGGTAGVTGTMQQVCVGGWGGVRGYWVHIQA